VTVRVCGPKGQAIHLAFAIDTTSRSHNWSCNLSPFYVGPCPLYEGAAVPEARRMENAWQFAKVYPEHVDPDGNPTPDYFTWAADGWVDERAHRYPMGKRPPVYTWWAGEQLGYVEARKRIYVPLYAHAVGKTDAFRYLLSRYRKQEEIVLWDFDGYDYLSLGMTLKDVLNDPDRKMGHAFVLAMLLEKLR